MPGKKQYQRDREKSLQNHKRYRENNKEKIREKNRKYYKNNREAHKKYYSKYRKWKKNLLISKETPAKWWKHKFEIDDVVTLYGIVRRLATITFYKKRNEGVSRDEMWERYTNLKEDFEEMQRMKKAA